jgi:hypothetical protein
VTGQVIYVAGADSTPVTGRQAVLHRVSMVEAGPVDSGLTDASGRYALRAPVIDTTANYVVSVEHDGIAYFTEPVHTFGESSGTAAPLHVYDTSTTEPQIILRERHVVVRAPAEDGDRRVIELLVLVNRGTKTRVVADTSSPVWQGAIPSSALEFEVGESDMAADAVYRRGNAVAVTAPIPPGERQVLMSYLVPSGDRSLPIRIDQPIERFNVLLEDTAAAIEGPLVLQGVEELEQLSFRRYFAQNIGPQTRITVRFAAQPLLVTRLWWIIVPLVVVSLVAGFVIWWRRVEPLPAPHAPLASDPDVLAAQIAALDVAYEGRQHDASYRKQRASLKAQLVAALNRQS